MRCGRRPSEVAVDCKVLARQSPHAAFNVAILVSSLPSPTPDLTTQSSPKFGVACLFCFHAPELVSSRILFDLYSLTSPPRHGRSLSMDNGLCRHFLDMLQPATLCAVSASCRILIRDLGENPGLHRLKGKKVPGALIIQSVRI